LKIALACDWFPPRVGGIEHQLSDLARALAERGHDVQVYTSTPGDAALPGVRIHRVAMRRFPSVDVVMPYPQYFATGLEILRRERFDVVHTHGLFSSVALGMQILAGYEGTPAILTCHSLVRGAMRPFARLLTSVFSRRVAAVTAVSAAVADDVRPILSRAEVVVVPNAIDLDQWVPERPHSDSSRIVAVTRLVANRNPAALVRLAARILPQVAPATRFTIVGAGPEQPRMERDIDRLGLRGRVEIVAAHERKAVHAILSSASVFVSTCQLEAFGLAALEARASAVPVVAFAGGGIADVVEHGVTGFLARDDDQFVEYVVRTAIDAVLRARLALACRAGLERFNRSTVAERYINLYGALAGAHAGRARAAGVV